MQDPFLDGTFSTLFILKRQWKFCGVPRMVKRKAKFRLFQLRSSVERKTSIQTGNWILKIATLRSCVECLLSEDGSSPLPRVAQAAGYN